MRGKRGKSLGCIVLAGLLCLFLAAEAESILVDAGNRFIDTATGNTWIDVDVFQGQSFNSVNSTLSVSPFHIATTAEITELFSNFPTDQNIAFTIGFTQSFVTGSPNVDLYVSHGFFDNGAANEVGEAVWFVSDFGNPQGGGDIFDSSFFDRSSESVEIGFWVVKPIPEPGTLLLFGTGLIGLAGITRVQREIKSLFTSFGKYTRTLHRINPGIGLSDM